jgi:hypothetical protein
MNSVHFAVVIWTGGFESEGIREKGAWCVCETTCVCDVGFCLFCICGFVFEGRFALEFLVHTAEYFHTYAFWRCAAGLVCAVFILRFSAGYQILY